MTEFVIDENAPVIVEFAPRPGVIQAGISSDDIVEKSSKALDSAMNTIIHMSKRVISTVDGLDKKPDSIGIEFGLKFDAEAGAILAKVGLEAALNVKLSWGK